MLECAQKSVQPQSAQSEVVGAALKRGTTSRFRRAEPRTMRVPRTDTRRSVTDNWRSQPAPDCPRKWNFVSRSTGLLRMFPRRPSGRCTISAEMASGRRASSAPGAPRHGGGAPGRRGRSARATARRRALWRSAPRGGIRRDRPLPRTRRASLAKTATASGGGADSGSASASRSVGASSMACSPRPSASVSRRKRTSSWARQTAGSGGGAG
jgi:hypothetical protein